MRNTAYNSTLAIGGVSWSADSFVVAESSVLRTNFCAEKLAHRQSTKRYVQPYLTDISNFDHQKNKELGKGDFNETLGAILTVPKPPKK